MKNTAPLNIAQSESSSTCDDNSESLTRDELQRFADLLAPDPSLFSGSRNQRRKKPNLYAESYFFDEDGVEHAAWEPPRKVDGSIAFPVHFEAGRRQETVVLPGFKGRSIRAVSIGYEENDIVGHFDLDLDGEYPIHQVMKIVRKVFGKDRTILHSGSGRAGRYRVFGLVKHLMPVHRLQVLLKAIFTRHGLPPKDGALEITPAYKHSRLPGGMGGCQIFDQITLWPIVGQDQTAFVRASLALEPIDLEAVLTELGIDVPGIDSDIAPIHGQFDPHTRRERRRAVPRHIRREMSRPVEPGQRTRRQKILLRHYLDDGCSCSQAKERFVKHIDDGYFDNSRDVKQYGREWLIKQVPKMVERFYATARPLGLPDPVPLSEREISLVEQLSRLVPKTRYTSPYRAKKMLLAVLPIFKAAIAAGLMMTRLHSGVWQKYGGIHYARMRELLGIFTAKTGWKPLYVVRSRYHLGAQDCEAYAISWACSFDFDKTAAAPTYTVAMSAAASRHLDPQQDQPTIFVTSIHTPNKDLTPSSTSVLVTTSSGSLPTLSTDTLSTLPAFTRLYDHHKANAGDLEGSDKQIEETKTPQEKEYVSPYTRRRRALQARKARDKEEQLRDPVGWAEKQAKKRADEQALREARARYRERNKPEWKRLREWCPPGAENMTLDEYFDALEVHAKVVREYEREKGKAKSVQQKIFNATGKCPALRKLVSWRCIDLQVELGLEPWR
jgi:hypothetical protein